VGDGVASRTDRENTTIATTKEEFIVSRITTIMLSYSDAEIASILVIDSQRSSYWFRELLEVLLH
jgi:hypothetical protein